jgi:hypothetical protein
LIPEGSVAAPDPVPFLPLDPGSYFRELRNNFVVKVPKFFDPDPGSRNLLDPGSGMLKIQIQDPG